MTTTARPTFTIITATLNPGEKLQATADSVLQQETQLEYILIDNCSTDQTRDLGRKLEADSNGVVRFYSAPDEGIFDAFNKGLHLARGRYLFFLGAGDTLFPGVLRQVEQELPGHDRAFVYGDFFWEDTRYGGKFTKGRLCHGNISHQAIFYGREIFALCGEYDLAYRQYADWAFNLRCFGRPSIPKIYLPLPIAQVEPFGASTRGDHAFHRDRWTLVLNDYGRLAYWRARFLKQDFPYLNWAQLKPKLQERLGLA